jgi:hypothetical protein
MGAGRGVAHLGAVAFSDTGKGRRPHKTAHLKKRPGGQNRTPEKGDGGFDFL